MVADSRFKPTFLLLLLGCFLCPSTKDVASPRLVPAIYVASSAKKYNWAEFILEWLVTEVRKYKRTKGSGVSSGGLFFLMIFYFHRAPLGVTPIHEGSYVIGAWDDITVRQRVQIEMEFAPKRRLESKKEAFEDDFKRVPPVFKNTVVQDVYDRIRSKAQGMLISFSHIVEGQLCTIDGLIGESSSAEAPPFAPHRNLLVSR